MREDAALFLWFFHVLKMGWFNDIVTNSNKQNQQEEEPDFSTSDLDWSEGTVDGDSKYNHQWD